MLRRFFRGKKKKGAKQAKEQAPPLCKVCPPLGSGASRSAFQFAARTAAQEMGLLNVGTVSFLFTTPTLGIRFIDGVVTSVTSAAEALGLRNGDIFWLVNGCDVRQCEPHKTPPNVDQNIISLCTAHRPLRVDFLRPGNAAQDPSDSPTRRRSASAPPHKLVQDPSAVNIDDVKDLLVHGHKETKVFRKQQIKAAQNGLRKSAIHRSNWNNLRVKHKYATMVAGAIGNNRRKKSPSAGNSRPTSMRMLLSPRANGSSATVGASFCSSGGESEGGLWGAEGAVLNKTKIPKRKPISLRGIALPGLALAALHSPDQLVRIFIRHDNFTQSESQVALTFKHELRVSRTMTVGQLLKNIHTVGKAQNKSNMEVLGMVYLTADCGRLSTANWAEIFAKGTGIITKESKGQKLSGLHRKMKVILVDVISRWDNDFADFGVLEELGSEDAKDEPFPALVLGTADSDVDIDDLDWGDSDSDSDDGITEGDDSGRGSCEQAGGGSGSGSAHADDDEDGIDVEGLQIQFDDLDFDAPLKTISASVLPRAASATKEPTPPSPLRQGK